MDFIINVTNSQNKHKLVRFTVPQSHLESISNDPNSLTYNELVGLAGWYYMNKIDSISCTGNFEWSIFPLELLETLRKTTS